MSDMNFDLLFTMLIVCAGYYVYSIIKRGADAEIRARMVQIQKQAAQLEKQKEELAERSRVISQRGAELARDLDVIQSGLEAKDAEIGRLKNSLAKSRQELTGARQRFERKLNKLNTRRARRL